jgi:hypothetical protein
MLKTGVEKQHPCFKFTALRRSPSSRKHFLFPMIRLKIKGSPSTSAASTHDGFLERDVSMTPAVKLSYCLEGILEPSYMILAPQDDVESGTWHGDIESSLWNTRGWTMQERCLSSRMLHFCKNKIYFECRTCRSSEENEPMPEYRRFDLWPRTDTWLKAPDRDAAKKRMYRIWIKTVQEYSARRLTKDFDKLTAIYSVAYAMATGVEGLGDSYTDYAGMWKEYLQHGLLWQVRDGTVSKPKTYRAPTWSWASLDGRLGWNEFPNDAKPGHFQNMFEVLEIGSGEDVENNFLKVKATVMPIAILIECDNDERWLFGSRGTFPHDIFIKSPSLQLEAELKAATITSSHGTLKDRYDAINAGHYTKIAEGRLDFDDKDNLTWSDRQLYYVHVDNLCRPSGLILESASKDGELSWTRVGVATIFQKNSELFHQGDWEAVGGLAQTRELLMV